MISIPALRVPALRDNAQRSGGWHAGMLRVPACDPACETLSIPAAGTPEPPRFGVRYSTAHSGARCERFQRLAPFRRSRACVVQCCCSFLKIRTRVRLETRPAANHLRHPRRAQPHGVRGRVVLRHRQALMRRSAGRVQTRHLQPARRCAVHTLPKGDVAVGIQGHFVRRV